MRKSNYRTRVTKKSKLRKVAQSLPAEQQVQEMVGADWFKMSAQDQKDLTKEMIAEGVVTTTMAEGGVVRTPMEIWTNLQPQSRYEMLTEQIDLASDEPLYEFTQKKMRKMAFLPYEVLTPEYKGKVEKAVQMGWGGKVMAEGGSVTASKVKVIYTLADGKMVTKTYDSKADSDEGITDFMLENDVVDVKVEEEKKKSLADIAKVEKKGAKSKSDHTNVELDGYEGDIAEYKRLNEKIKIMTADKELVSGRIKEAAKQKYLELYEDKGVNPNTLKLVDGDESILYVPQDKYLSVTDEKKAMLENYGEGLVETVTTYEFTDVIEKELPNGQTIGEVVIGLIMDNNLIPEKDKLNLIKAKVVTRVPKGTIDRLLNYENPEEVFNLVQPTVMLR